MNEIVAALAATVFGLPAPALKHEPLWGESPQTFAFGVHHPEVRFGYENSGRLMRGSSSIANPDSLRRTRQDLLLSYQYAPKTTLNIKVDVPLARVRTEQRINGELRGSEVNGFGNIMLSAKNRFHQRFGEDWKIHHSFMTGLLLPTGKNDGRMPDGTLLSPGFQPGSDKFGMMLGYAYAFERLKDTSWASLMYMRDFGGAGARGDLLTGDAAYGYWIKRAERPQDLGIITAVGPHLEIMGRDRLAAGPDPDSGFTVLGIQASFIATKDTSQYRIGIQVPVYQRINGTQLRPELQIRAGWEMLL